MGQVAARPCRLYHCTYELTSAAYVYTAWCDIVHVTNISDAIHPQGSPPNLAPLTDSFLCRPSFGSQPAFKAPRLSQPFDLDSDDDM